MQHKDVVTGAVYAFSPGSGRPEAGASSNVPAKVLDRDKVWVAVFVPNGTRDAIGRRMGTTKVLRYDDPQVGQRSLERHMLVQALDDTTMEPVGKPQLALPRNLACEWDRHLEFVALREAAKAAKREQDERNRARRERITDLLMHYGVQAREGWTRDHSGTWTMDPDGALALIKRLAELGDNVTRLERERVELQSQLDARRG